MKLSIRALKEWVDCDDSAEKVVATLAELGFPNDGIDAVGAGLDQVVVGRIVEKAKHPQADRLSLLKVTIGAEVLPIVCGASNMKEGDYIALAPVGAKVPGKDGKGLQIKESKIRGELSKGMCCSQAELALSEESEGLWILPTSQVGEADLGKKVSEVFPLLADHIAHIDITPNRPDAMSVRGLAREFAAKRALKLKTPAVVKAKWDAVKTKPSIENFSDSPAFAAALVQGVSVKESPEQLRRFLTASGSRSISNLVDITNCILFDWGHPIHFFDADKMDPLTVHIRRAKDGEKLRLLNEKEISLSVEDLVVADQSGALSLAGIMGGASSAVSETTKNILIEVACFQPQLIRESAKRHGLSSESSLRFERGLTPFDIDDVLERSLYLLKEYSGFDSVSAAKTVDNKVKPKEIVWSRDLVEKKLGRLTLSDDELFESLRRLDYAIHPKGNAVVLEFPWYRVDSSLLEDAMEDLARLVGYDHLEKRSLHFAKGVPVLVASRDSYCREDELIDRFVSQGFSEIVNLNFSDQSRETMLGYQALPLVTLVNPLNAERGQLRSRLLPELVLKARENAQSGEDDIWLVEAGSSFLGQGVSRYEASAVTEQARLACLWYPRHADEKFLWNPACDPFYVFKGKLEALWSGFRWSQEWNQDKPHLHPSHRAEMRGGFFGELHPQVMKRLDMMGRLFVGEWILHGRFTERRFGEVNRFPAVDLDASFWISKTATSKEVLDALMAVDRTLLEDIHLYDVYEPKDKDQKSMTFAMRYRAQDRTLALEEAKAVHDALVAGAIKQLAHYKMALR